MKHLNKISLLIIAVFVGLVFFTSCGEEEEPTTATVYGTIEIANTDIWGNWIDSGEVQVTIFPEFDLSINPPSGWGDVPAGTYGPSFPGGYLPVGAPFNSQNPIVLDFVSGKTSYTYKIENIDPGTYSALAVGFRKDNVVDANRRTAPIGVHWGNPNEVSYGIVLKINAGPQVITIYDEPAPSILELEAGDDIEINFKADFDLLNTYYN